MNIVHSPCSHCPVGCPIPCLEHEPAESTYVRLYRAMESIGYSEMLRLVRDTDPETVALELLAQMGGTTPLSIPEAAAEAQRADAARIVRMRRGNL